MITAKKGTGNLYDELIWEATPITVNVEISVDDL